MVPILAKNSEPKGISIMRKTWLYELLVAFVLPKQTTLNFSLIFILAYDHFDYNEGKETLVVVRNILVYVNKGATSN